MLHNMKFTFFFFFTEWIGQLKSTKIWNFNFAHCATRLIYMIKKKKKSWKPKPQLCFFNLSFFIYQIYLSHVIVLLWVCDQHMYSLWIFFPYNVIFPSLFLFPEVSVILFLFLLTFTFHSYLLFLLDFELSLSCITAYT